MLFDAAIFLNLSSEMPGPGILHALFQLFVPDAGDGRDPFVVVHQGCKGGRIPEGGMFPQQPAALTVHREEAAPEGHAENESFVAVAPPEIIDVRHFDGCRRIGIESIPDVSDAFVEAAQILVSAAQLDQIFRLFPKVEWAEAVDILDPLDERLRHLTHKVGKHADPAVFGPSHQL